jgi:hypothetical protein
VGLRKIVVANFDDLKSGYLIDILPEGSAGIQSIRVLDSVYMLVTDTDSVVYYYIIDSV